MVESRLSIEAKQTLWNHDIYQLGNSLVSSVSICGRLTNDLWINGAFQLIMLASAPIATIYMGKIAKIGVLFFMLTAGQVDHVWFPWITVFVMMMQLGIRPLIYIPI